jgi:hypothetical protein
MGIRSARSRVVLAAMLAAVLVAMASVSPGVVKAGTPAPPCSSWQTCDGRDPVESGCAIAHTYNQVSTVATNTIADKYGTYARVELKYSSWCASVWARVTELAQKGAFPLVARITRTYPTAYAYSLSRGPASVAYGYYIQSAIMYDAGSYRAKATGMECYDSTCKNNLSATTAAW